MKSCGSLLAICHICARLGQLNRGVHMLVTFKTDVHADIIMFGDAALALLKIMGHSGTIPSALDAEDVPAALKRLQAAIELGGNAESSNTKDNAEPHISIAKRALPLIELLTKAAAAKTYVIWE